VVAQLPTLDATEIADTVEAVFSAQEFNPPRSIWWWTEYLPDIPFDLVIARRVLIAAVIVLAVVAVVRYGQRRWLEQRYGRVAGRGPLTGAQSRDPWVVAQQRAAAGDYTAASHALYMALLEALARKEQLRLHPSKTAGDYRRELRARSSSLLPTFQDFARLYELVAYGFRQCDVDRYHRLYALASVVTGRG